MVTQFQAIQKALNLSTKMFPNEIIVVFQKIDGSYDACVESEYLGDEDKIFDRYMDGHIVSA